MRHALLTLAVGVLLLGSAVPATAVGAGGPTDPGALPAGRVAADAGDGRANATTVPSGEELEGDLHAGNPADWYAIELDAGEAVRAVGSAGMGGVVFSVHGPDGAELDAIDASTARAAVGAVAGTDGTYYVRAAVPEDEIGGGYDLTVSIGTDDPAEPNGGTADADPAYGVVEATLVEGDEDWYAVEAEAGDLLTASALRTDGGDTDVGQGFRLDLVSPSGEFVGLVGDGYDAHNSRTEGGLVSEAGADTAFQRAVAGADGTYYVRVVPVADDATAVEGFAGYTLAAYARTPAELGVNESVGGTLSASATGDRDAYALDAAANETLRIAVAPSEGDEFAVSVYGANGSELANRTVSEATTLNATVGTDGRVHVVPRLPAGGGDVGYTLSVGVPGRPAPAAEEADGTDGATAGNEADDESAPIADGTNGAATPDGTNGTATPDRAVTVTVGGTNGIAPPDGVDAAVGVSADGRNDGAATRNGTADAPATPAPEGRTANTSGRVVAPSAVEGVAAVPSRATADGFGPMGVVLAVFACAVVAFLRRS